MNRASIGLNALDEVLKNDHNTGTYAGSIDLDWEDEEIRVYSKEGILMVTILFIDINEIIFKQNDDIIIRTDVNFKRHCDGEEIMETVDYKLIGGE